MHEEWAAISHDGTYKIAKTLIGSQADKSAPRGGRSKALHTIRGRSGAVRGICVGFSESREECLAAVKKILPLSARQQCKFVYTDDVSHFLSTGAGSRKELLGALPNLRSYLYP